MSEVDQGGERMGVEEFIRWQSTDDLSYELIDGVARAMAPPSARHGRIQLNVGAALHARLRPPCAAYVEYGIVPPGENSTYFQADLAVVGPNPRVLIEVVSPTSIERDRGLKADAYRRIDSCDCILLIFSDRRRVERWTRDGERWLVQDHIGGAVPIAAIELNLELDEIYAGTDLGE